MKKILFTLVALMISSLTFAQVAYLQYRQVPADKEAEFVERETKYWSKVAKSAIDDGLMTGWSLWRKVGITTTDAPNYVFVNTFPSTEAIDPEKIWNEERLKKALGTDPANVETNSFTTTTFDYWMKLEAAIPGDYKYALVNYAMPDDLGGFIEENKSLWQPMHQKNIESGNLGMRSWGMMSVIYPSGKNARFSVMTWDGFQELKHALNYLSYTPSADMDPEFRETVEKSKMNTILPGGFEWSILYERVMSVGPEE